MKIASGYGNMYRYRPGGPSDDFDNAEDTARIVITHSAAAAAAAASSRKTARCW